MLMDDYKKYSLEQLDNWIHDAISCSEATPQEIYDTIKKAVEEEYYAYKHRTSQAYELLALLNGNGEGHLTCDKDDPSPECKSAWNDFWEYGDPPMRVNGEGEVWIPDHNTKKDKVKKWLLPVQCNEYYDAEDYYVNFPDDLLEAANLKEGDQVEWIDQGNGSYIIKKVVDKV